MTTSFIHLPHRSVLALRGPDTIALLERLVTNATTDWRVGETRYGALLTPQGKVIADYLACRTEDGALLDVASEYVDDLAKRLKMFRLRSQVAIEVLDGRFIHASLEDAPSDTNSADGAEHVYRDPRYQGGRLRALVRSRDWATGAQSLDDYHTDRIAHVVPEQGADFGTADVFPADINMDVLSGVALNKGCFVGQEVVSRMHRRGKIRKRTLRVETPGLINPPKGTEIKAPHPIATITSSVGHHALALTRVDRLLSAEQAGETPVIDETPVTIEKPAWLLAALAPMEDT